jgi:hypothetical protein
VSHYNNNKNPRRCDSANLQTAVPLPESLSFVTTSKPPLTQGDGQAHGDFCTLAGCAGDTHLPAV